MNGVFLGPEPILYLREELNDGGGVETHGESEDETVDQSDVVRLEGELAASNACNEELEAKVSSLSGELARVMERVNEIWKLNCAQMVESITAKDAEIEQLTAKVFGSKPDESCRCRPCSVDTPATSASPHTNFSAR